MALPRISIEPPTPRSSLVRGGTTSSRGTAGTAGTTGTGGTGGTAVTTGAGSTGASTADDLSVISKPKRGSLPTWSWRTGWRRRSAEVGEGRMGGTEAVHSVVAASAVIAAHAAHTPHMHASAEASAASPVATASALELSGLSEILPVAAATAAAPVPGLPGLPGLGTWAWVKHHLLPSSAASSAKHSTLPLSRRHLLHHHPPLLDDRNEPIMSRRSATAPRDFASKVPPPIPAAAAAGPSSPAPKSHHDLIVNKLLDRPGPVRTNSLPSPALHPAELTRTASDNPDDSRPVTKLLDGPLEPSGGRVTRALTAQIEAVLKAQEEIASAHLALENVGAPPSDGESEGSHEDKAKEAAAAKQFDALENRSASVEEIMHKLAELSTSLKSYHAIGTPMISFPRRLQGTHANTPASPCTPQILVATAGEPRDTHTLSPDGVSILSARSAGMVQSPAAMTPGTTGTTGTGTTGTGTTGTASDKGKLSINTKRPDVSKAWIHRAGFAPEWLVPAETGMSESPAELTPARFGSRRPWDEQERERGERSEREREWQAV